jgi:Zn-dependent protease
VTGSANPGSEPRKETNLDVSATVYSAFMWVVPIFVAITFHEAAHAFVAWMLGDDTAFRLGRVTCANSFSGNPVQPRLAIFNMIPVPPLDGSRIAMSILPVGFQGHMQSWTGSVF